MKLLNGGSLWPEFEPVSNPSLSNWTDVNVAIGGENINPVHMCRWGTAPLCAVVEWDGDMSKDGSLCGHVICVCALKASKEAGQALVCKINPNFEVHHHHLLHCLEKTTVRTTNTQNTLKFINCITVQCNCINCLISIIKETFWFILTLIFLTKIFRVKLTLI